MKYELQGRDGNAIATTWAYSEAQAFRNFAYRGYNVESESFHIAGGTQQKTAPQPVAQADLFGRRS